MTLTEIRARALAQAGEQESALNELENVLTQYINEGQTMLCPGGLSQTRQLAVTDGRCELCGDVTDLIRLRDALGRDVTRYRLEDQTLCVAPDGAYTARLLVRPGELSGDDDVPDLPESFHGALADYATWRLLSNGGRTQQVRAEFYHQAWLTAAAALARQADSLRGARRRINRYA